VSSYLTAPVVDGAADWGRAVKLPETGELWRRRAVLWRGQRDRLAADSTLPVWQVTAAPPDELDRLHAAVRQLRAEQRITRQVAASALERLLAQPSIPHQGVDRVRAYLAGERRLP
jgi:hypothetical protein